jgi:hypothetical protein
MRRCYLRVFRIRECGFASIPLVRPGRISLTVTGLVAVLFPLLAYLDVHRGVEVAADRDPVDQFGGGNLRALGPRSHVTPLPRRLGGVMKEITLVSRATAGPVAAGEPLPHSSANTRCMSRMEALSPATV